METFSKADYFIDHLTQENQLPLSLFML